MPEKVMLVIAEEDDANATVVAGALNLIGSDALFGRNWGCTYGSAIKNLHFELCYYQVCAHCFPSILSQSHCCQYLASACSGHIYRPRLNTLVASFEYVHCKPPEAVDRIDRLSFIDAPAAVIHDK